MILNNKEEHEILVKGINSKTKEPEFRDDKT